MACMPTLCVVHEWRARHGSCPFDYHTTPGTLLVATMGGRDCGSDGL